MMYCPECHAEYTKGDTYCSRCEKDLTLSSMSLVTTMQTRLPALQNSQVQRSVATGVGAVALGVGIELLRRGLVARFASAAQRSRGIERALPVLSGLKDVVLPNRTVKVPKGYVIDETIVYTRRVIRRER